MNVSSVPTCLVDVDIFRHLQTKIQHCSHHPNLFWRHPVADKKLLVDDMSSVNLVFFCNFYINVVIAVYHSLNLAGAFVGFNIIWTIARTYIQKHKVKEWRG